MATLDDGRIPVVEDVARRGDVGHDEAAVVGGEFNAINQLTKLERRIGTVS